MQGSCIRCNAIDTWCKLHTLLWLHEHPGERLSGPQLCERLYQSDEGLMSSILVDLCQAGFLVEIDQQYELSDAPDVTSCLSYLSQNFADPLARQASDRTHPRRWSLIARSAAMATDLIDALLASTPDGPVLDVRIGLSWTAVVVEVAGQRRCGLAATLRGERGHGSPTMPEAGFLVGKSGREVASWARSDAESLTQTSVGFAALNALLAAAAKISHGPTSTRPR